MEYFGQSCVHQLFEAQAARTPDAPAAVFVTSTGATQQLSYAELNQQANQLAHYLRARGVGPETCVGICLERSLPLVVAVLGVLKAGGAYLPLDTVYPVERLQFMLEDAQTALVLTQESLLDRIPASAGEIICLDRDQVQIAEMPTTNPAIGVLPDQLAYVMYTSGSTGRPKGVLIPHRGLCNLGQAEIQWFEITPADRILQFASFSFDVTMWEILMALLSGASLYLATAETLLPGPGLIQLLSENAITVATLPPAVLTVLPTVNLPSLRVLISAADTCSPALVERWSEGRLFFNAYGPTEITVCATVSLPLCGSGKPPIGRLLPNVHGYVLDAQLQPVPVGTPGELSIGGVGVGRGYLNRPELTAERFLPDPFSATPGSRMYRSGDLVCFQPDGQLDFLGRIDQQVKLRGFRIELGEIETTLQQHPHVREAVVVVRQDANDPRLVAYVTERTKEQRTENKESTTPPLLLPQPSQRLGEVRGKGLGDEGRTTHQSEGLIATLRAHLGQHLPSYMIPSAFVVLAALPLTANGKLDRNALPAPEQRQLDRQFVAPRSALEEVLGQFWREVLGVERVSVVENFFDLGGHSLLATQVMSRVQQVLRVDLPAGQLFETPTIEALAQLIQARETAPGRAEKAAQLLLRIKTMSTTDLKQTLQQKRSQ